MRVATPMSLLLVTLIYQDDESVCVFGPYNTVSCFDENLMGEPYPDGVGKPDTVLARYDSAQNRWVSATGRPIIIWKVQSVDEIENSGNGEERAKAGYIRSEFGPEATSAFAKKDEPQTE